MDLDSPEDDPIIVDDDSKDEGANIKKYDDAHFNETKDTSVKTPSSPRLELEKAKVEAKAIELKARPSSFNMEQLKELMVKSLHAELPKLLSTLDFSSFFPTELKELPSKFIELSGEVKNLKKLLNELEWELPEEFLSIPTHVASVQAKLKTLDALPSHTGAMHAEGEKNTNQSTISQLFKTRAEKNAQENLNKHQPTQVTQISSLTISLVTTTTTTQIQTLFPTSPPKGSYTTKREHTKKEKESSRTKKLKKFDFVTESGGHFHLTEEQINVQKKVEEDAKAEAAKLERERRREELVDLLGPKVVEKAYKDKLQKGPTTLKVYREGDESEIIPNFKASDLHLSEWREMETKQSQLHEVERELRIDLDNPLGEQDPLNRPNDLARSKRKNADDLHDYFKANKRLKSSVQHEDHLAGTVLNEHVLGMIMFNSFKRQDFVTIEDFKDFNNTMLYTVQEIFFRLHQGLGLTDHARTFSSYLLAEIDRRNLNPIKQMRVIEQLRQQMP
ncbi:hypothetical protein Tco_0660559 [Tanacetum coccineum]